mmetsp:Transcript_71341/g.187056  ORF Transcript_71341/g.187056 Transcript_71341/m.187056 type:complete len:246 (+) Transcript_71341:820-1557(+)
MLQLQLCIEGVDKVLDRLEAHDGVQLFQRDLGLLVDPAVAVGEVLLDQGGEPSIGERLLRIDAVRLTADRVLQHGLRQAHVARGVAAAGVRHTPLHHGVQLLVCQVLVKLELIVLHKFPQDLRDLLRCEVQELQLREDGAGDRGVVLEARLQLAALPRHHNAELLGPLRGAPDALELLAEVLQELLRDAIRGLKRVDVVKHQQTALGGPHDLLQPPLNIARAAARKEILPRGLDDMALREDAKLQ